MKRSTFLATMSAALSAALFSAALPALAQDNYPSKTIRFVVPYPPGGPTDLMARMLQSELSTRLGVTGRLVVVLEMRCHETQRPPRRLQSTFKRDTRHAWLRFCALNRRMRQSEMLDLQDWDAGGNHIAELSAKATAWG